MSSEARVLPLLSQEAAQPMVEYSSLGLHSLPSSKQQVGPELTLVIDDDVGSLVSDRGWRRKMLEERHA